MIKSINNKNLKNTKQDIVDPSSLSTNVEIYSNKIDKTLKTGFENISLDYLDNRERRVRALNQLPVIKDKIKPLKNKTKDKIIRRHIRYKCPICGDYKLINHKIKSRYNKLCSSCLNKIKYNFPAHLFLNLYLYNEQLKEFLVPDIESINKDLDELNESKAIILEELLNLNKQAKEYLTLELTDKIVKLKARLNFINDSITITKNSTINILSDKIKIYFKSYLQDKIKLYNKRYNYRMLKLIKLKLSKMASDTLYNLDIDLTKDIDFDHELIISDNFNLEDKIYFERFRFINYYKVINLILTDGLFNFIDFLNLETALNSRLYYLGLVNKEYYYNVWDNLSKQPRAKFKKLKSNLVNNKNFKVSLYSSKIKFKELYTFKLKLLNNDLRDLKYLLYNFNHGDIIKIKPSLETDKVHVLNKTNIEALDNLHKIFLEDINTYIEILSRDIAEVIYNAYYNDKNRYNLFDYKIIPIDNYIENIKYRVVRAMIKKNKKT